MYTAIFFGLWFMITSWTCCAFIYERSILSTLSHNNEDTEDMISPEEVEDEEEKLPFVVNLLAAFNNVPFRRLLPAWMCDNASYALCLNLLQYYIACVIQPEESCRQ